MSDKLPYRRRESIGNGDQRFYLCFCSLGKKWRKEGLKKNLESYLVRFNSKI